MAADMAAAVSTVACAATPRAQVAAASLAEPGLSAVAVCALARLVDALWSCTSISSCSHFWVLLVLFFGHPPNLYKKASSAGVRLSAWESLQRNYSDQTSRMRLRRLELLQSNSRARLDLYGHPRGPSPDAASGTSALFLYTNSAAHLREPHVEPFVRQLRCYAELHGMSVEVDIGGSRVRHRKIGELDVNIAPAGGEFVFAMREEGASCSQEEGGHAQKQLGMLLKGSLDAAGELVDARGLSVTFGAPLHFGRAWALADMLSNLAPGALGVYFDSDVTIRLDSWRESLAEILIGLDVQGREPAHVFIADTWTGIECVNSGFLALRNTRVAHTFLELWKEKLWWSASWDQAALAETVLELVGAEMWRLSGGAKRYDSRCMQYLVPMQDRIYSFTRYCDCWYGQLEELAGPYRRRTSRLVGFVDPESVEMNYLPNSLFHAHSWTLEGMRLVPHRGREPLRPMVVHWAGLGPRRLALMKDFLRISFNVSWDARGCPVSRIAPHPVPRSLGTRSIGSDSGVTPSGRFGTRARHVRCCEKLLAHRDKREWPWTDPQGWLQWVHHWGCNEWEAVRDEDCTELLGQKIDYIDR